MLVLSGAIVRVVLLDSLHWYTRVGIAIAIGVWYLTPGLLGTAFGYESFKSALTYRVTGVDFWRAYCLESGCAIAIVAIIIIAFRSKPVQETYEHFGSGLMFGKLTDWLLLFAHAVLIFAFAGSAEYDYVSNNRASAYVGSESSRYFGGLSNLLFSSTFLIACRGKPWTPRLLAASCLLAAYVLFTLLNGNRLVLIVPIAVIAFRSPELKRKFTSFQSIAKIALIVLFIFFVVFPLSSAVQNYRSQGRLDLASLLNRKSDVSLTSIAAILFTKFDSFSTGHLLVRYDGVGEAGITPYIGSAFPFVPRALWPQKPAAGSKDGSLNTHPSRLVPRLVGFRSDAYNVGVSPAHIAIWQFGYLGTIVYIAASAIYIVVTDRIFKLGGAFQVVAVYLLACTTFDKFFAPPDFQVLRFSLGAAFLAVLYLMYKTKFITLPAYTATPPRPYLQVQSGSLTRSIKLHMSKERHRP
jgi:hypothetical protein